MPLIKKKKNVSFRMKKSASIDFKQLEDNGTERKV